MNPGTGHKWSGLRVVQVQRLEKECILERLGLFLPECSGVVHKVFKTELSNSGKRREKYKNRRKWVQAKAGVILVSMLRIVQKFYLL